MSSTSKRCSWQARLMRPNCCNSRCTTVFARSHWRSEATRDRNSKVTGGLPCLGLGWPNGACEAPFMASAGAKLMQPC